MPEISQRSDESGATYLARYLYEAASLSVCVGTEPSRQPPYRSYEHLVWALGRPYTAEQLPPGISMGWPKLCYTNTLELVRALPTLSYAEGFAWHARTGLPYLHAWGVDPSGRVWDRTWEDASACAYYGIPFARAELERFDAMGEDYLGIIASQYLLGHSLMRTGHLFPATVDTSRVHTLRSSQEDLHDLPDAD